MHDLTPQLTPQLTPRSARLAFSRFDDGDAAALAALLGDPEIIRTITANTSTPEKAAACARHRIAWHNGGLGDRGLRGLGPQDP